MGKHWRSSVFPALTFRQQPQSNTAHSLEFQNLVTAFSGLGSPKVVLLVCFQFRASPFFLAAAPRRSPGFVHLLLLLTSGAAALWALASRFPGAAEAQFQLRMTVPTAPPPVLVEAAGYAQASIILDLTQLWPKDSGKLSTGICQWLDPVVSSLSLQTPARLCSHSAYKFSL